MVLRGWGRFDGKSRLWRDEAGERGWQRVCRSSIGRFSPRSAVSPFTSSSRAHHHLHLHPPLKRADGLGQSGRRREADKRIALSSRNDIFDQHFHITPAEALSRITQLSYSRILRLLSSLFYFLPFPPSFSTPLLHPRLTGGGQLVLLFSLVLRFLSFSLFPDFVLPFLVHTFPLSLPRA